MCYLNKAVGGFTEPPQAKHPLQDPSHILSWAPWNLSRRPTLVKHRSSPAARKSSVGMKPASQQVSADCSLSQWFCSVTTPHPQEETVATRPIDISQVGRPDPRNANISLYDLISVPSEISRPSVTGLQLVSVPFNRAPGTKENIPNVWTHAEQWVPHMQTLSKCFQQRTAELCPFPVLHSANWSNPKLTIQHQSLIDLLPRVGVPGHGDRCKPGSHCLSCCVAP